MFMAIFIFTVSTSSWATAAKNHPILSSYRVHNISAFTLQKIAAQYEISGHSQPLDYEVVVPKSEAAQFLRLAPQAQLLDPDMRASIQEKLALYHSNFSFKNLAANTSPRYHSFAEVQSWLKNIEATHPQFAKVTPYGTSREGRPLLALRLTENIQQTPAGSKPELMITAATHGDELITVEVLMNLVDQIVMGQSTNARLASLIAKHDIYFIPVVNPDGFADTDRYDNGIDPNRSYPYPGHENKRPTASIAGLIQFFHSHKFAGSIDFHAFSELVMYPWGYTHAPIEKSIGEYFNKLTASMAQTNGYTYGPIADVIYIAPGSSCDYYFWKNHTIALGIEIGQSKIPDPTEFQTYFDSQTESTWRFIESF